MKHVPNALTLLRLVLAPVIAWLMWEVMIPSSALNSEFSSPLNAADYIDLVQARAAWIARMETRLAPFDAVLCPTVPIVAPPVGALRFTV